MALQGYGNQFPIDDALEKIAAEMYPEIARQRSYPDGGGDTLEQLSATSARSLQKSMKSILAIFAEEEALLKERSQSQDKQLKRTKSSKSLLSAPDDLNPAFSLPDACYQDMAELECLHCEFSRASNCRLLTLHRLKSVGAQS